MAITLHERHEKVTKAALEVGERLHEIDKKYDLTYPEMIRILADQITIRASGLVRYERHRNSSKKGDEE